MPSTLSFAAPHPLLIGVVHLAPSPGSARYRPPFAAVVAAALADARALLAGGADALLVENFGDAPFFPERVPPESVASLAICVREVQSIAGEIPVGVNVLRNDARAALGICAVTGGAFLRVNVHTGAAVTDQGVIEGRAHETLRERARLAPGVALLADAHVKHASSLGRETLAQAVTDLALRGLADAVIVSGSATGSAPGVDALREARAAAGKLPLLVGSGLDARNAAELLAHADGAIVGTSLKLDGRVEERVDPERVAQLRRCFDRIVRR